MMMGGHKASTTEGNTIATQDALDRYGAEPLRYYLAANMPEYRDTTFHDSELVRCNNDELVATYGNAVHRVLTFVARHMGGRVPSHAALATADQAMLDQITAALHEARIAIEAVHLRDGLNVAMGLAHTANRYLDNCAPWHTIKRDAGEAATALYVMLQVLSGLKTLFAPYLPFSSQRLHELLGFTGSVERQPWAYQPVPVGQHLPPPAPLFVKLDLPGGE
jgi:methionyl-tRNA synthetase